MLFVGMLRSKACRWEFGYVRKPELVHVYVPSGDKSPGRIVKWEELMEDVELCKQLFGGALGRTIQANLDAEDPTMQGTFTQLEKMAETAEEQEHQAWCELPFRQLAYNFAANTFGEESVDTMSQRRQADCCLQSNWICSQSPTNWKGFVGENGEEIWQRPLHRSHNFDKSGHCAWRPGRLQPEEGPARACPENQGAALRERTSLSSHYFGKSGQCAWKLRRLQAEEGPARACPANHWSSTTGKIIPK